MPKTIGRSQQRWLDAVKEKLAKGLSVAQAKNLVAREQPALRRQLLIEANNRNAFAISQIKAMVQTDGNSNNH